MLGVHLFVDTTIVIDPARMPASGSTISVEEYGKLTANGGTLLSRATRTISICP